jgi:hypothetical protein
LLDSKPADVRLIAGRTATVVDLSFEPGPRERSDGISQ